MTATTSVRHPVLLSLWGGLLAVSGVGLSNPTLYILVFLVSPVVAIATFAEVWERRQVEVLRPGWSIVYRVATAGLAVAGVAGVVATAGRLAGGRDEWFANAPLAILFLGAFLTAWRALSRPSPRRAAIPAMVILIAWCPLLIANVVVDRRALDHTTPWLRMVAGGSLIAILALSAIVAVLSLVSFQGEPEIASARATSRM